MRSTLLIQADRDHADSCRWVMLDTDGRPAGAVRRGTISQAAGEAAGLRVVALAPGIDCVLTQVSIPGRNRQKLLRAVPYALEEQFSEDVEDLHFALGLAQEGDEYPVAVVAIQRMNALLEPFTQAGLEVHQLVPDLLTIPCEDDAVCVLIDGGVSLVRSGPYSGFAVDTENLGLLLAGQLESGEEARPVRVILPAGGFLPELDELGLAVEVEQANGSALDVLARGLSSPSIDLLQGAYSRSREWGKLWRPWRASAALLLIGIVLAHVAQGIDYFRLKQQQAELDTRIETVFKETFPDTWRVVNPRVQMEQQLEQLQRQRGGGPQFMTLLARAGDVLRAASDVDMTGASFRAGRLDLDLSVASLQILDELKQTLAARGLEVEIQSATTEAGQRVKSRLRIQGGGA